MLHPPLVQTSIPSPTPVYKAARRRNLTTKIYYQKTIKEDISFTGIGVHSGLPVTMTLKPAPQETGYVFVRTDLPHTPEIRAHWACVTDTSMSTKISNDQGDYVSTIEHIIAALAGLQIHNVRIEIDGPEVPIMDGSSMEFSKGLLKVGIRKQTSRVKTLRLLKPIHVAQGNSTASLFPAPEPRLTMVFDLNGRLPFTSTFSYYPDTEDFFTILSQARTFGFLEDAQRLQAAGLARGASLENTVVIGDKGIINEEGLRFEDELVRHKVLDAIGDLSLSGYRILGHFHGINSGHGLNNQILRTLFADPTAWVLEEVNKNILF